MKNLVSPGGSCPTFVPEGTEEMASGKEVDGF